MANFKGSPFNTFGTMGSDPEWFDGRERDNIGVRFSVAVNRQQYDSQSQSYEETTEWYNCTAFGRLAEQIEKFLRKGDYTWVSGYLKQREYERRDGTPGTSNDLNVDDVHTHIELVRRDAGGDNQQQNPTNERGNNRDGDREPDRNRNGDRDRGRDRGRSGDRGRSEDRERNRGGDRERDQGRDRGRSRDNDRDRGGDRGSSDERYGNWSQPSNPDDLPF